MCSELRTLKLEGSISTKEFTSSQDNIEEGPKYDKARVLANQPHESLWIIYSTVNYDHDHPGPNSDAKRVVRSSDGLVTLNESSIRSAQGFNVTNAGLIGFEHTEFRGHATLFEEGQRDISRLFPPDQPAGLSSVIITGGKWSLCKEYDYKEPLLINGESVLGPGEYSYFGEANDRTKSLKYIGPS